MDERASIPLDDTTLESWLSIPSDRRMAALFESFRRGWGVERVREISGGITRWFLHRFSIMASIEAEIVEAGISSDIEDIEENSIRRWKGYGFSDAHIVDAMNGFKPQLDVSAVSEMTKHRHSLGIHPVFRMVDSCAAEFLSLIHI